MPLPKARAAIACVASTIAREILRPVDAAHADAAAAARRLDEEGKAGGIAVSGDLGGARLGKTRAAGEDGDAGLGGDGAGTTLVAHGGNGRRLGADPDEAGLGHGLGEGGVLGEEAVAGVNGVSPCGARRVEHGLDVEVAPVDARRPDVMRLVGKADVPRRAVGVGKDGHRFEAEAAAGGGNAAGDLAAIGDEDAFQGRSSDRFVKVISAGSRDRPSRRRSRP